MSERPSARLGIALLLLCASPALLLPGRALAVGEIYWFSLLSEDVDAQKDNGQGRAERSLRSAGLEAGRRCRERVTRRRS